LTALVAFRTVTGEVGELRAMRIVLFGVWLLGGALTLLHGVYRSDFVVHSPSSSAVLETIATCGATLLAALSFGRWRERRLVPDLLTCNAFSMLAVGNVLFVLVPTISSGGVTPSVRAAALVCGGTASLLFMLASIVPERSTPTGRSHIDLPLIALAVLLIAAGAAVVAAHNAGTFAGLSGTPSTEAAGNNGGTGVTAIEIAAATAFAIGSWRFARRARRNGDHFYGWLAVTAALWTLARVNFAFTSGGGVDEITIGDWLRLSAYAVAVVAAASEFTSYWRRLAETAVLEERRRIARDLHDGLAQELAFIATRTRSLSEDADGAVVARAAERALDESRRAIAALTRAVDEPLDVALAQQAEELGGRLGIRVLLDLEPVGIVASDTKEALLRIAREAITNAGRHGRPSKIVVSLGNHNGITLRVSDDGRGFRVDDPRVFAGGRYGIAGMSERAEALGGRVRLESRPYGGTKVEVWVP
jgi:signal transduction histidine kinase